LRSLRNAQTADSLSSPSRKIEFVLRVSAILSRIESFDTTDYDIARDLPSLMSAKDAVYFEVKKQIETALAEFRFRYHSKRQCFPACFFHFQHPQIL